MLDINLIALPVLSLDVHQGLDLSTFLVGFATRSQFAASSGNCADTRSAKRPVVNGLLTAVVSGLFSLLSLHFVGSPQVSASILLLGRALLGGAESFIITGAVTRGLALVGQRSADGS
jgi:hypothetical protein